MRRRHRSWIWADMTSNGFADDRHEAELGIRDWDMASFPADWDASSSWASVS